MMAIQNGKIIMGIIDFEGVPDTRCSSRGLLVFVHALYIILIHVIYKGLEIPVNPFDPLKWCSMKIFGQSNKYYQNNS